MKPRQQRMLAVGLAVAGVAIAAALTLRGFQDNMMYYVEISDAVAGNVPDSQTYRVGGLVVDHSVRRKPGDLQVAEIEEKHVRRRIDQAHRAIRFERRQLVFAREAHR